MKVKRPTFKSMAASQRGALHLGHRPVPKLDDATRELFEGIHKSKRFTIEAAHKHFAHLKFTR